MPTLDDLYRRVIRDRDGHWIPRGRTTRLRKLRVACWEASGGGSLRGIYDLAPQCKQLRCCAPEHQRVIRFRPPAALSAADIAQILADERISRIVAGDYRCAPSTIRMIRAGHRHKAAA